MQPDVELRFWCDRKFATQAKGIVAKYDKSIPVSTIFSGKLRRYHSMPLVKQLLTPSIVLPNIRDLLFAGIGFVQSVVKLVAWRPDVVFTKGGFVCLPVGYAAKLLRIPLVIHDSDAHPGLTNRLLAPHATTIATGSPLEYYPYPKSKSHYVGIPVDAAFRPRTPNEKLAAKRALGVQPDKPLVVVTGGGLGAVRINNAVVGGLDTILPHASVILISGMHQYEELKAHTSVRKDFQLLSFVSSGMADMLGAADVVVARAGATTLLELAGLSVPTIIVPNGLLTGGHQLKNAKVYSDAGAVAVVEENAMSADSQLLARAIISLLDDASRREMMSVAFHAFAKPAAARDMAALIVAAASR